MRLQPKDLRIDTYSNPRKGGWSLKRDNGVKITHIPTGLEVRVHTDDSQEKNKAAAMEALHVMLLERDPAVLAKKAPTGVSDAEPIAYVPVHPRSGPLWSDTLAHGSELHRSNNYPLLSLYAASTQSTQQPDKEKSCIANHARNLPSQTSQSIDAEATTAGSAGNVDTGTTESDLLVTMTITVNRAGLAVSDVQTHNNSYSEVAIGLAAVRDEINRVFAERKNCPYYPRNSEDARRKIVRSDPTTRHAQRADAFESALSELIDKIVPGLDSGDLLADAMAASKRLDGTQQPDAGEPVAPDDESVADSWITACDIDGIRHDGPSFERGYRYGEIAERDRSDNAPVPPPQVAQSDERKKAEREFLNFLVDMNASAWDYFWEGWQASAKHKLLSPDAEFEEELRHVSEQRDSLDVRCAELETENYRLKSMSAIEVDLPRIPNLAAAPAATFAPNSLVVLVGEVVFRMQEYALSAVALNTTATAAQEDLLLFRELVDRFHNTKGSEWERLLEILELYDPESSYDIRFVLRKTLSRGYSK